MRPLALIADALLVAFVVALAVLTLAQVHQNQVAALHGHGPRDKVVATRTGGH